MVPLVAGVIIWSGYTLLAYGWSQVRGCNVGLRDLAWPGRAISCNPDGGPVGPGSDMSNALPKPNPHPSPGAKNIAPGSATGKPNSVPPGKLGFRTPTPFR